MELAKQRTFYHNNSTSNEDFLFRLDEIPLTSYADSSLKEFKTQNKI